MKKTLVLTFTLTSLGALASNFSIGEPVTKWTKTEISVCFATKNEWTKSRIRKTQGFGSLAKADEGLPFTLDQKSLIQDIVTANYTEEETGIHFTGWKDCSETPKSDVYLFRMEKVSSLKGKANIGDNSEYHRVAKLPSNPEDKTPSKVKFVKMKDSGLKEYVLLNTKVDEVETPNAASVARKDKTTFEEHFQMTTLHEFGHIAGLRHEHARLEDAKEDINCKTTYKNVDEMKEEEAITTEKFSVYDPNSIMSYCYLRKVNRQVGLQFKVKSSGLIPMNLTDNTIYTKTLVNKNPKIYEYNLKIALSALDKHSLRCLYLYDQDEFAEKCNADFSL